MNDHPHIVILGAGPAGLGAAKQLALSKKANVTVLEQNDFVGGNASSFEIAGVHVDFGSHRLHPACDPEILQDIRTMLGEELLKRPRHGRILLSKRWIHFPLKPFDLLSKLPPDFTLGVVKDMVRKVVSYDGSGSESETFASVMEKGLGKTICHDFYFPYARKIWGLNPEELSVTQAYRRVSNNSLSKMTKKVLSAVPGFKPVGSSVFYYPRKGYGQISQAYSQSAQESGAEIILGSQVNSVEMNSVDGSHIVSYERDELTQSVKADYIWSTIPITALIRIMSPKPPEELLEAAQNIDYRAMILIYLVLEQDRFSEYDAHYFPELEIPISRLSEPKNYSNSAEPKEFTVLCAELPCATDDPEWEMTDSQLSELVHDALRKSGIPIQSPIKETVVKRLRYAYPMYRQGYEMHFDQLDEWTSQIDGLLTFGRQGLFAHDNTHHALFMAYSAVSCLDQQGRFDKQRWQEFRRVFETHVVED
jgi:protoporphyrinogen oxidase